MSTTEITNYEEVQKNWASMGVAVKNAELELQAMAQEAIISIVVPDKIEQIPDGEALVKKLRSQQNSIKEKRMTITSKFDAVTKRLMEPEKSIDEPIKELQQALLALKKEYEKQKQMEMARNTEIARLENIYRSMQLQAEQYASEKAIALATRMYEKALEDNIQPDAISAFISQNKGLVTEDMFKKSFDNVQSTLLNEMEVLEVMGKNYQFNPKKYVEDFHSQVDEKFADYEVALHNKEAALQRARDTEEAQKKAERERVQNAENFNKLKQAATERETSVDIKTKDLKKGYEVDMPDTMSSALMVMAAFGANISKCEAKLRNRSYWKLSVDQMAKALGAVKSDDNQFQPEGIIFKETARL